MGGPSQFVQRRDILLVVLPARSIGRRHREHPPFDDRVHDAAGARVLVVEVLPVPAQRIRRGPVPRVGASADRRLNPSRRRDLSVSLFRSASQSVQARTACGTALPNRSGAIAALGRRLCTACVSPAAV